MTLPSNTKENIKKLILLQRADTIEKLWDDDTSQSQRNFDIVLLRTFLVKNKNYHILNYKLIKSLTGCTTADIQNFLNMLGVSRSWKNVEDIYVPFTPWDEKTVNEFLAALPESCYDTHGSQTRRNFHRIVLECFKATGEVITLDRAKQKDSALAVLPEDFSEEQWKAYDFIKADLARMNLAAKLRENSEITNSRDPLVF